MGVYIKGMEMPHSCMDCIMSNFECDWCILSKSNIPKEIRFENRMKQCPLVPAADVRPVVRGEWISVGTDDMDEGMYKCSECGSEHFFPDVLLGIPADNFCPNCGADMRTEEGEEWNQE